MLGALASAPALALHATGLNAQSVGPENGTLVIVGGALSDPEIVDAFIELSGGPDAPIVVIPTAGADLDYDDSFRRLQLFRDRGATNLTVLHTRDRSEADTEAFVAPIREAGGVWFTGGRQWRLADSYLGTRTEAALWDLLARDGVIGGSSAGATIQGSYLARGDTRTNTIMMGDHEEGFAFLRDTAIDQHLLARNRQFDLIEVIEARPELLGIGLDENTAILVRGDQFSVIGESYVAIYDHDRMIGESGRFMLLGSGDGYDLATRRPVWSRRNSDSEGRVQDRAWPR
jgi:cyanophycinase